MSKDKDSFIFSDDSFLYEEISILKAKPDEKSAKQTTPELIHLSDDDDANSAYKDEDEIKIIEPCDNFISAIGANDVDDIYGDVSFENYHNQAIQSSLGYNEDNDCMLDLSIGKSSQAVLSTDNAVGWMEDDDEFISKPSQRLLSTPAKHNRPSKILTPFGKKATERKNRLKGTKIARTILNKQIVEPEKPPTFETKDALQQITLEISSQVTIHAEEAIQALLNEKMVNFRVVETGEDLPCVTWKASDAFSEALSKLGSDNFCIRINGNLKFEQLFIVVDSQLVYSSVCTFLDRTEPLEDNNKDDAEPETDLLDFVNNCCRHYSIYNVTLVVFGMDKFHRSQRNRENNSFRRKINEMLTAEEAAGEGSSKTRKRKEKEKARQVSCEQVEACLVDCKMNFFLAHHEAGGGRGNLTILRQETGEELASSLFRYTRSLSEQIFRFGRVRSNVDFFAQGGAGGGGGALSAIDPTIGDQFQRILWLRQLMQFPNLSSKHAEAIVDRFATPLKLWQALRQEANPIEMLSNIRANDRAVGLEAATKIYLFISTMEPDTLLKLHRA